MSNRPSISKQADKLRKRGLTEDEISMLIDEENESMDKAYKRKKELDSVIEYANL